MTARIGSIFLFGPQRIKWKKKKQMTKLNMTSDLVICHVALYTGQVSVCKLYVKKTPLKIYI